jgi:hypothetical protein
MADERFKIPRRFEDEAEHIAITARLRPLAESETVRSVLVTYWREGVDIPLVSYVHSSQMLHRVERWAPAEATHLTIEVSADG